VLAVLLVSSGCTTKKVAIAPTTVPAITTTTLGVPVDLRTALFAQFPAGYVEAPVGVDSAGPLTLATAAAAQSATPATETPILKQYGFVSGYQRVWVIKGSNESLNSRVLVMGSAFEAMEFYNVTTFADEASAKITTFPTSGLVNSDGFKTSITDANGSRGVVWIDLVRGPLFYHIGMFSPPKVLPLTTLINIAQSQSTEDATFGYT
jgi:hypothetical protein